VFKQKPEREVQKNGEVETGKQNKFGRAGHVENEGRRIFIKKRTEGKRANVEILSREKGGKGREKPLNAEKRQ